MAIKRSGPAALTLGERVVAAVGWSAGVKVAFQVVTWAMTLAVIRILSPDDYGLMALSQVFINVLASFVGFGLGDAVVQRADAPRPLLAAVAGLLLGVSAVLAVLISLAAPAIAGWYAEPRLTGLIQAASLGFLFEGMVIIPRAQITRSLRIRPMVTMEMAAGLVGAVTVILLAVAGWGVWALMVGGLLGGALRVAGFALLSARDRVWPSWNPGLVRPLLHYGAFRTLEHLAWIAFTSADVIIIGRWLGPVDLGLYTVALNFAGMPLSKVAPIINQVAFPAFALVQADPAEGRYYVMKAMRLMAALAVPVFFGISAVAPEVVDLVFGPHWAGAKPMLAVLALAMSFRAVLLVIPNYLQGIGDARAGFLCTLTGAVLFPPAFIVGCAWGIMGVCWAWLLGYPVMFVVNVMIAARRGRLDFWTLLLTPLRPMLAGAAMLTAVALLRPVLPEAEPVRAAVLVAVGAAVYLGVMMLAFRPLAMEILALTGVWRPAAL
jgi:teichuronic acid exporter